MLDKARPRTQLVNIFDASWKGWLFGHGAGKCNEVHSSSAQRIQHHAANLPNVIRRHPTMLWGWRNL
eukprot:1348426-Heterocapsa_arctica.AAC.1